MHAASAAVRARASQRPLCHTMRCFFSGLGRTPALPAFALTTMAGLGLAVPFPFVVLTPFVDAMACDPSPVGSLSRLVPRLGSATVGTLAGAGVATGGLNAADVGAGVGMAAVPGVGIDCGVPMPTGVRPRGWLGLTFARGIEAAGRCTPAGFGVAPRAEAVADNDTAAGVAGRPDAEGVPATSGVWPCIFASFLSSLRFFLSSRACGDSATSALMFHCNKRQPCTAEGQEAVVRL